MQKSDQIDLPPMGSVEDLLSLLGDMPNIPVSRNNHCLCGSGKKYKKCCLIKDKQHPNLNYDTFRVTSEPMNSQEIKDGIPDLPDAADELLQKLYDQLYLHPETIDSENCEFFQQLHELRQKYPEQPSILNFIGNGYQILGLKNKLEGIVLETYEKFPNYLFGRVAMGLRYLHEGRIDEAWAFVNGAITLKQLYPNRDLFHITEVRIFHHFLVKYFCAKGEIERAETHLGLIKKLNIPDNDPLIQDASKAVKIKKGMRNFQLTSQVF